MLFIFDDVRCEGLDVMSAEVNKKKTLISHKYEISKDRSFFSMAIDGIVYETLFPERSIKQVISHVPFDFFNRDASFQIGFARSNTIIPLRLCPHAIFLLFPSRSIPPSLVMDALCSYTIQGSICQVSCNNSAKIYDVNSKERRSLSGRRALRVRVRAQYTLREFIVWPEDFVTEEWEYQIPPTGTFQNNSDHCVCLVSNRLFTDRFGAIE
ncbi:18831_t:CDS:2 [Acaulospora morrowiae]|uniref:18831_t:CDS:1 n=1 Tax=Acaulospora morrowiae TaxID=94023 RepID=A0A9N8VJD9_9GLOM|nr:18831_t:CDS:2 [Acaulospora morrowiae]